MGAGSAVHHGDFNLKVNQQRFNQVKGYEMLQSIFRWPVGRALVKILGDQVKELLDYTKAGSGFVYGSLVNQVSRRSSEVKNVKRYGN